MSIAIARGKETIAAKGYGYASLEDSTPASAQTVYPIASITKQFTAAAVMQLIEDWPPAHRAHATGIMGANTLALSKLVDPIHHL